MVHDFVEVIDWPYDYSTDVFPVPESFDFAPYSAVHVFDEAVIDFVVWVVVVNPFFCFNSTSTVVNLICDVRGLPRDVADLADEGDL